MTDESCVNCNRPASGTHDLLLRSKRHEEVPLCEDCHEAIRDEIAEQQ